MLRLKYRGIIYQIAKGEILYCQIAGNYLTVFLEENKRLTVHLSLQETLRLLDANSFYRCNHSTIINLARVLKVDLKRNEITLKNQAKIRLSCRRKKGFLKALHNFKDS
jgi:DNA-binding LytR/AlgR family response regulator